MSPAAAFHSQLASIMEVLANTAVAEICELVDSGYSVLQLEISRSRKENEVLRRKLRLMELRAARATALRAAGGGSGGGAMLLAGGRSRAHLPAHPGTEPRRNGTPRGQAALTNRVSNRETLPRGDASLSSDSGQHSTPPAGGESTALTAAVIKVEDDDDEGSWSQSERDKEFCLVIDGQTTETEAPPPPNKQEVAQESGDLTRSWVSEEVSSTSSSVQKNLNTGHMSESSGYHHLMYEPQLQHGPVSTHNALSEDPSCSYVLNAGAGLSAAPESACGIFTVCEVTQSAAEQQQPAGFQEGQERAPLSAEEPQLPARKDVSGRQNSFVRRDRWRHQGGASAASCHSGGKSFVCNYCSKTLACLKNLKTHMRVHTGEKPFVCALCGKRFSDSSNLKRHQSVHTGEKRYGCVHCGKRFAQSGSLKVHMTVHTDCKQFRCSYCSKTFISGSHLRRHVTVHAGEKPLPQMPQ